MINQQGSPTFLLISIAVLFLMSLFVAALGKKLPGRGSWLIWAGLMILLVGVGLDSGIFLKDHFETRVWSAGWIWSRDENGAITLGMFQDPIALAMVTLLALVSGTVLLSQGAFSKEVYFEKVLTGLGISTAGVALAWASLTPWMEFLGLSLTILGGFLTIGSRWDSGMDAKLSAKFATERSVGFLLAFLGACILAASRPALILNDPELWMSHADLVHSTWVGAILLISGTCVQLQPFPFLGLLVAKTEGYLPLRILLGQVLPAWACFPLLIRLEPQFRSLELFPSFGWVALTSSILTVFAGLFQKDWDLMVGLWLSAGLSLSVAALAFSGPYSAMALLIGVSLSAISMAGSATALDSGGTEIVSQQKKALWIKAAVFLAVSAGTGMVGFVTTTGYVRWITQALAVPATAAVFLFNFALFVFLGWRLAWKISFRRSGSKASLAVIISSFLLVALSLASIWTGTVTGELIQDSPDRLIKSLFDRFFTAQSFEAYRSENYFSASSLYWGVLVFSIILAYWVSGRKQDRWTQITSFFPRASQFIARGYGVDHSTGRLMDSLEWLGRCAEKLVDVKIWSQWMPNLLSFGVKNVSEVTRAIDHKLTESLNVSVKKLVDVPAKLLQLIQTGDLRWYLFFALSSGFALLAHFLKL